MYKEQKINDYNHVLNKLQDYMFTGKLMANISYNQSFIKDIDKNKDKKIVLTTSYDDFKLQVKQHKEKDRFFFPKEKDQLFWCFYIIKEDVEDELANKQTIGMKTFVALCVVNNINLIYIHKRKCFEIIFDEESPIYVVHCHNNSDSSGYKYCYEENISKEQIEKYRSEYFKWVCVEKPLKAITAYKLDELIELCKKLGLTEMENKKKTNLYELLVMNL